MAYLLALDQGTTSSRAIVFREDGEVVSIAQREFTQHFPQSGWVEHDPLEIWQSQLAVARQALAQSKLSARDIAAIGITNQRETTVVWDRATGLPIHRAIVWQDRRTASVCEALKAASAESLVRAHTGLLVDAYFSGTKIAWILDHVEGARTRAERGELAFGTVDSWLIWNLTGGTESAGAIHVTDVTNASRTMLFDIHSNAWSEALCALLRVPSAGLPKVVASSGVVGVTWQLDHNFPVPIAGVAGDQQAALFGQACHEKFMVKNTYGTGCFMLSHLGAQAPSVVDLPKGLLLTSVCQLNLNQAQYAIEGSVFIGGAVVQWLRDGLGVIGTASEVEALASSVPSTDGVAFVPAFAGLGAPYWNSQARGAIIGLSRGSTTAHIARAALEAISFQSAELLQAMSTGAINFLRVDGGATANNLLMQMQADLGGVTVVRPKVLETTALGVAYLAGLAVGVWPSIQSIAQQWQVDRVFEPQISSDERLARMAQWKAAVSRVL